MAPHFRVYADKEQEIVTTITVGYEQISDMGQTWWHTALIPTWEAETGSEFKAKLVCIVSFVSKTNKQT